MRFRRAAAVADAVREAVRAALASAGYSAASGVHNVTVSSADEVGADVEQSEKIDQSRTDSQPVAAPPATTFALHAEPQQERIGFAAAPAPANIRLSDETHSSATTQMARSQTEAIASDSVDAEDLRAAVEFPREPSETNVRAFPDLPPIDSVLKFVREVAVESLSSNIRPLGQLDESFIVATDDEGLLLIDQHVAHERVLFDKYRALEASRKPESQQMLIPETFDLTPAQAAAFDAVAEGLESYGFELMRLSGRTVAIKSVPADLPLSEARNVLSEVLDTVDLEKRGTARATLRDEIAASLACHAAIKINMSLAPEKMRWLIDRLLMTSSPTTCPHGRPVILRLATQDILKGFHRI